MKFLIDKEINLKNEDLLNTSFYSATLKEVILNAPEENSFTIGLLGEWGSGKSSIIKTVKEDIEQAKNSKIKFVIYDAWKYSNDSFRRTFLLQLQENLGFEKDTKFETFYQSRNSDINIDQKINKKYLWGSLLILFLGIVLIYFIDDKKTNIKITLTLVISLLGVLVTAMGRAFSDYKVSVVEPPLFAPEQFEECFEEMISLSLKSDGYSGKARKWVKGKVKAFDKIIIVVDNIDRCPKELAYELFTNIKNFLKNKKDIIYLIPVDSDALKRHIMKGGNRKEADEFLRKFFNLTIRIKPFKRFDLYDFADSVNSKKGLELSPTTLDIVSKEYATNPRRIIQFFNNLIAELAIFESKDGAEFSKRYESLICKALIIREEWPEYYKMLSYNPNILSNPTSESTRYTSDSEQRELHLFLNATESINQNIPYEIIEIIFSTHDRKLKVPAAITEAINKKDFLSLEKFMTESIIPKKALVNNLIEKLNIGLQRELYQTEVNNVIELLCNIDKIEPLSRDEHRRIYEEIGKKLNLVFPDISDLNGFCQYSNRISQLDIPYLDTHIRYFISSFINNPNNPSEYPLAKKLFLSYVKSTSVSKLKILSEVFTKDYSKGNDKIASYEFSPEILVEMIEDNLLLYIINELKEFSANDKYYSDMIYLSNILVFSENVISAIYDKINGIFPHLHNVEKDSLLTVVKNINLLLSNEKNLIEDPNKIKSLKEVYTKFTGNRNTVGGQKNIFSELKSDEEKKIFFNFILTVFRVSNERIDIKPNLEKLIQNSSLNDACYNELVKLKKSGKYNLLSLREIILKNTSFNQAHLELLEHLFNLKKGADYLIDDPIIKEKLVALIKVSIDSQNPDVINFLEKISEEERLKRLLREIIENLGKDDIIRLTQKLCFLAFDKISESDNIFKYEENIDLLKAIATRGTTNHVSRLLRVINAKLQREEKVNEALDILEEVDRLTETQILGIKGDIENIFDPELKEEAKEIISAKKDISVTLKKSGLIILKAIYYSSRNHVERNITRKIRKLVVGNKLILNITNELVDGKDPDHGQVKDLRIDYIYNGFKKTGEFKEHTTITIPE